MIVRTAAILLIGFCLVTSMWGQVYQGEQLVHASLLSEMTAAVPGKVLRVGVLLEMAPGWHTYWAYPGDSGLATQLKWTLPEGWKAGSVEWPMPERLVEPGDLVVYGYKKQVLLMTTLEVPAGYSAAEAEIQVASSWLVCAEICVPGEAKLSMVLPVASSAEPMNEDLFGRFGALVPSGNPAPFETRWRKEGGDWLLTVSGIPKGVDVDFYPTPSEGQIIGHVVVLGDRAKDGLRSGERGQMSEVQKQRTEERVQEQEARKSQSGVDNLRSEDFRIPVKGGADDIQGILVVRSGVERKGYLVKSTKAETLQKSSPSGIRFPTLWLALLYGFVGGVILNLMPCVLPVISLKVFGFIQQAGKDRKRILAHGMAFVGGIFSWFLGLALVVVLLRAGGTQVNWAFQFQNAWFMLFISAVVFMFALNLFGVFEVVLPGRVSSEMSGLAEKQGYAGSFFQGVFATLLATPCTAPFLGTALGFAFSQPATVIFAMFGAVALGMASPYFLLSVQPGWMRFLPRPGTWMERVKQLMGFPLVITLIWLLSVIGGQKGVSGIIWTSSIMVCLAFACWLYGAFVCGGRSIATRWIAGMLAILSAVGGGYYFGGKFSGATGSRQGVVADASGIPWMPFSKALLEQLLAEGKPVFVDFTADWCLTCKFNEKTAINTPAVRKIIAERGIIPLKADWTNQNAEIGDELKKYGRVGVPFYLVFSGDKDAQPIQLPELLTEQIVIDALKKVGTPGGGTGE